MKQLNNFIKNTNPYKQFGNPKNQKEVSENIRFSEWKRKKESNKYFG